MPRSTLIQARWCAAAALALLLTTPVAIRVQAQTATEPILHELNGIDHLRTLFEGAQGKIRVVMLLSPTWPACINAARWAQQEFLPQHTNDDLRIYAVWFNMYPGDSRSKWPTTLLTDARVTHFWDEQRVVGKMYLSRLPFVLDRRAPNTMMPEADALWDAFFVYQRDAAWQGTAPAPVTWGYPIMPTRETLASTLAALTLR